jgi:hypothetical protein
MAPEIRPRSRQEAIIKSKIRSLPQLVVVSPGQEISLARTARIENQ